MFDCRDTLARLARCRVNNDVQAIRTRTVTTVA